MLVYPALVSAYLVAADAANAFVIREQTSTLKRRQGLPWRHVERVAILLLVSHG